MQVLTKDVATLATPEIIQEQVQVDGDVGETSVVDVNRIDANLEKTILMIEKQQNVVPILMLEEENINEDVELHAQIDGGDILNFLYNLLPHASYQVERMGGVFFFSIFLL
jgi:low affinity Fe/Cu permease